MRDRALVRAAVEPDAAAVRFDDSMRPGQSEPAAASCLLMRKERIEGPLEHGRRHADPVVPHRHFDHFIGNLRAAVNGDVPAARLNRISRVAHQLCQQCLDLHAIHMRRGQPLRHRDHEARGREVAACEEFVSNLRHKVR